MTICKACGQAGARVIPGPQVRWCYWRCVRCGHVWLDPAPTTDELTQYYNATYAVPRELYTAHVPRKHRALKTLLGRRGFASGRMLEVGCSYGAMLDAFRRDGWEVEGIELDARAAEIARSSYGLHVHQGRLEDVSAELSDDYDVITLYHVLEHVADPAALIRELGAVCRSGGVILIKTPNARSFVARVLAAWWEWYAAPEHVQLFAPTSLRTLL
jgi:2-polyprenyl-3-methyl-5-hydroxy-6-metoxy-1,4-benzoquinol methylase